MYPVSSYYDTTSNISIVKVLKISDLKTGNSIITVEIIEKLKGKIAKKKKIDFITTTDNCSFHFHLGEKYLLFFHSREDKYEVNECSYSDLMKKSWSNIRKIRELSHHKRWRDGTNPDDDHDYWLDGSLKKDKNKNIASITYNYLKLPEVITFEDNKTITTEYDAEGTKLKKIVSGGETTDYGGSLKFGANFPRES